MAEDDYDCLPLYIEEDQEEAAAEKEKRRQESRRPPPPPITPGNLARMVINKVMAHQLYEYDPKLRACCYTRVWFLDFTEVGIDEETQYGPMRFTDSPVTECQYLNDSLNIIGLNIRSSDVCFPINVYGTVLIRDYLDLKCNYIFRRDRDNCQLITSSGDSLILTGPSRGVVFLGNAFFEIDLKIRGASADNDMQFSKALIDVDSSTINKKNFLVQREAVDSWLSGVDLTYAFVKRALEGTVEIKILSGPESLHGKITASTTDVSSTMDDVSNYMLLYDSYVWGPNLTDDNNGVVLLLRHVVAVSADQRLVFNIMADSGDENDSTSFSCCEFTPLMRGEDKVVVICGPYKLQVKIFWSKL